MFLKRTGKYLFLLLKIIIFVLTFIYLWEKVIKSGNFDNMFRDVFAFGRSERVMIAAVMLLMIVNWSLEALKWKILMKKVFPVSFLKAFVAILSGVTVSTLMPNRTGEYFGRIFYVPTHARLKSVFTSIAGNLAQLLITIALGTFGILYYLHYFASFSFNIFLAAGVLFTANLALLLFLFRLRYVYVLVPKKYERARKTLRVLGRYKPADYWFIILLSFFRYLVFTLQFLLVLNVFKVALPVFASLPMVFSIYFVQSVVPSITLLEFGIRGAASVHFLGFFSQNFTGILSASYLLWFINIILPAVSGAILLFASNYLMRRK
jgi:uncharacterized membrane protein YwzB